MNLTYLLSLTNRYYHQIYYIHVIVIISSLPLWPLLTSISLISVSAFWLVNGFHQDNFAQYLKILKKRKSVLIFISIYLIHILGLLYTSDFHYALKDLRIKLPLFSFPLVVATSKRLTFRELKILLLIFTTSLLISSFNSVYLLISNSWPGGVNIRRISRIIYHIRFSLLINTAIFSLLHILHYHRHAINKKEKWFMFFSTGWLIVFLFILRSLTGIVVLFFISFYFLLRTIHEVKHRNLKRIFTSLLIAIIFLPIIYIVSVVIHFYDVPPVNIQNLDKKTAMGNRYTHHISNNHLENGHYVGLYICEKELRKAWNKRSTFDFDGLDKKKHEIRFTLIRYLTSKGFRKDAEGVRKLSEEDVTMIENGYSNYIYKNKFGIYPRIYQSIWELDVYFKGGNPSGHSITQRIEFVKNGLRLFKKHPFFGVGTGDIHKDLMQSYQDSGSKLDEKFRRRAHNQYLTFFITFGIVGGSLILFALFLPPYYEKKYANNLFMIFFLIAVLSMINEDTLETQAGLTFFVYFYALYLWGIRISHSESAARLNS